MNKLRAPNREPQWSAETVGRVALVFVLASITAIGGAIVELVLFDGYTGMPRQFRLHRSPEAVLLFQLLVLVVCPGFLGVGVLIGACARRTRIGQGAMMVAIVFFGTLVLMVYQISFD